ncbi:MAG: Mur ligase domain-containing protein, partial [Microthrixaceae bacterium]
MADAGLDLSQPRRIHITNVGGAGMSAVATLLVQMGHTVTGHESATDTPFLGPLRSLGVEISSDSAPPESVAALDAVVVSTATSADHPDVVAARAHRVPVVHRARALAAICRHRRVAAVAGTHGKTTTSGLVATILASAGVEPGWVVGAAVSGLQSSASWGGAGPLVVEADESDGTFLALGADTAIVTNVEADHLEHWGSEAALRQGFVEFVAALKGPAVLCLDDVGAAALVASALHPVTYGTAADSDYRIEGITPRGTGVAFRLHHGSDEVAVELPAAPGIHNARNGAAAIALAHQLGVPLAAA